jgi:hypothetical protein
MEIVKSVVRLAFIELSQVKVQTLFIIIAHLSSRKKDEPERNVGVLSSKARTQVFSITQ